ncbi:MAG: hypothetical protein ABI903_01860 [Actinomycetota bacterium]
MTESLVRGDHVSCSRVGGAMRRESSRLRQQALSLAEALSEISSSAGPGAHGPPEVFEATASVAMTLRAMQATADDLDEAGAALQRYATDLAEGHELGRRAERRVAAAGLLLEGTRVTEPWGLASAREAERRRAQVPDVQSRIDLATAHVGRARGRLQREMTRLTDRFSAHSRNVQSARRAPLPGRRSGPT